MYKTFVLFQAEMYSNQQQKAEFLQSLMGKGIMLLSLSMIKYSWYIVMKQNCERLDRIQNSTTKVKMLAACSKAFTFGQPTSDAGDDDIDYEEAAAELENKEEEQEEEEEEEEE